jgi:hypothetical protein
VIHCNLIKLNGQEPPKGQEVTIIKYLLPTKQDYEVTEYREASNELESIEKSKTCY